MSPRGPGAGWVLSRLLAAYGAQGWWPARSRSETMIGAVLVQHTAWANAARAVEALRGAGTLDMGALAALDTARLADLVRPAGTQRVKARRLAALARWCVERGGVRRLAATPTATLRADLLAVHGVGAETADVILLYAFSRPVAVIDMYERRLARRLGVAGGARDDDRLRARALAGLGRDSSRLGEYHALVVAHGRARCAARPRCRGCPLESRCGGPEA